MAVAALPVVLPLDPVTLPEIGALTVKPERVPTLVRLEARTLLASVAPLRVPAAAVTVMSAVPLNETPLMFRAVWRAVAVAALPLVLALDPVTLPEIGFVTVRFASVPTLVKEDARTLLASVAPVSVPASAATVIAAVPSKFTPLIARAVCNAVAVAALPVVLAEDPLTLPVRSAVIVPAVKLPLASRATIAEAVLAAVAVVAVFDTLPAVEIVASFVSTIPAAALMSASTMTPAAMLVALPTLVTSPVRLAFVVTLPAVNPAAVPVMFVPTKADGVPRSGVVSAGELAKTSAPVPVSSVMTPASSADVVAASADILSVVTTSVLLAGIDVPLIVAVEAVNTACCTPPAATPSEFVDGRKSPVSGSLTKNRDGAAAVPSCNSICPSSPVIVICVGVSVIVIFAPATKVFGT